MEGCSWDLSVSLPCCFPAEGALVSHMPATSAALANSTILDTPAAWTWLQVWQSALVVVQVDDGGQHITSVQRCCSPALVCNVLTAMQATSACGSESVHAYALPCPRICCRDIGADDEGYAATDAVVQRHLCSCQRPTHLQMRCPL
jgi:hypothetical protein